jgi:hypothetical protein
MSFSATKKLWKSNECGIGKMFTDDEMLYVLFSLNNLSRRSLVRRRINSVKVRGSNGALRSQFSTSSSYRAEVIVPTDDDQFSSFLLPNSYFACEDVRPNKMTSTRCRR